jgi:hypothetical protein
MNSQIRVEKHKNFSTEIDNKVLKTQWAPKTLNLAWIDCFKINMQNATWRTPKLKVVKIIKWQIETLKHKSFDNKN